MDVDQELKQIAVEAISEGIHTARCNHRILATFATRQDSSMLAHAAMDALEAVGLKIVPRNA